MVSWDRYVNTLRQLYPTADEERILEALDYQFSWEAIGQKASELGIIRQGWGVGKRGVSPFHTRAYCKKCGKWVKFEDIPDDDRCPLEIDGSRGRTRCNNKLKFTKKTLWWKYKEERKKNGNKILSGSGYRFDND